MNETINYNLRHAQGVVDLVLAGGRFIVNTQGVGRADRLRTIDIDLSDLKHFCVVPTIGAQNIVARRVGEGGRFVSDGSYDAEFIFSYKVDGKSKKKRVFVNSYNQGFQSLLETLASMRPDASLLHLEPADAQKQIGVMSARKALFIIVGALVLVPIAIAMIAIFT